MRARSAAAGVEICLLELFMPMYHSSAAPAHQTTRALTPGRIHVHHFCAWVNLCPMSTEEATKPRPVPPAVTPGGPAATPDTPEGREHAEDEGEEA
jgi:hypothetical protein